MCAYVLLCVVQFAVDGDADSRPSLVATWSRMNRRGTPSLLAAAADMEGGGMGGGDYLAAQRAMEEDMIRRAMAASVLVSTS